MNASCRHTHHAIDIVLDLVQKHNLTPEQIDNIVVETGPMANHTKTLLLTRYASFSYLRR
ncbi:hypothetical protein E4K67_02205 [Desulfosporosinus fructosivorans]|uniref:MmgE/PrpD C-terminal domain-containing protein n=1 Tax=Desulfosporosinus fructosivorans TaxID=2018669 RepID=A0A4Z0RDC0_9FIRM|nr:hypothetical protein E4K67_02205 [Desulfosporosinus fructosivorans]